MKTKYDLILEMLDAANYIASLTNKPIVIMPDISPYVEGVKKNDKTRA